MMEQLSLWEPDPAGVVIPRYLAGRSSALDADPPIARYTRVLTPEGVTGFVGLVQFDETQRVWFCSVFTDDPIPPGLSHYRVYCASSVTPLTAFALEDLTCYSRASLKYRGEHDQARRAWLALWAQEQGHPERRFTLHGKHSGYYKAAVPQGEDGWKHFLERAVQFDIYCAFVSVFTPQITLEHYLTDAAARGEIRGVQ
jgi:hypothetical protein